MTLRAFIEKSNLSAAAFARQVGCSTSFLSEILSGAKEPGLNLAIRIEKASSGAVPIEEWSQFAVLKTRQVKSPSVKNAPTVSCLNAEKDGAKATPAQPTTGCNSAADTKAGA